LTRASRRAAVANREVAGGALEPCARWRVSRFGHAHVLLPWSRPAAWAPCYSLVAPRHDCVTAPRRALRCRPPMAESQLLESPLRPASPVASGGARPPLPSTAPSAPPRRRRWLRLAILVVGLI